MKIELIILDSEEQPRDRARLNELTPDHGILGDALESSKSILDVG